MLLVSDHTLPTISVVMISIMHEIVQQFCSCILDLFVHSPGGINCVVVYDLLPLLLPCIIHDELPRLCLYWGVGQVAEANMSWTLNL